MPKSEVEEDLRKEVIENQLNKIFFPAKKFITAKELVKWGLFGSHSAVYNAIKKKNLEALWISDRRYVIVKESLIDHILKRTKEKLGELNGQAD